MCNSHYVQQWGLGYFNNFTFTFIQNLREIKFRGFRSAKYIGNFNTFRGSEFWFFEFLHFLKAEFYQNTQIQSPEIAKTADL